jgi:hypothetical protein
MTIPIFHLMRKMGLDTQHVQVLHVCYHEFSDDALHTMSILKVGFTMSTRLSGTSGLISSSSITAYCYNVSYDILVTQYSTQLHVKDINCSLSTNMKYTITNGCTGM